MGAKIWPENLPWGRKNSSLTDNSSFKWPRVEEKSKSKRNNCNMLLANWSLIAGADNYKPKERISVAAYDFGRYKGPTKADCPVQWTVLYGRDWRRKKISKMNKNTPRIKTRRDLSKPLFSRPRRDQDLSKSHFSRPRREILPEKYEKSRPGRESRLTLYLKQRRL